MSAASNYTDHAGLEIPVDLCIASPFSRQIAVMSAIIARRYPFQRSGLSLHILLL